jgi:hypothetical protein
MSGALDDAAKVGCSESIMLVIARRQKQLRMLGGNDGRDCLVSKMVAVVLFRKWLRLFDISNAWRQ